MQLYDDIIEGQCATRLWGKKTGAIRRCKTENGASNSSEGERALSN